MRRPSAGNPPAASQLRPNCVLLTTIGAPASQALVFFAARAAELGVRNRPMYCRLLVFSLLLACGSGPRRSRDAVGHPAPTSPSDPFASLGRPFAELPPGGIARLGSHAFHHEHYVTALGYTPNGRYLLTSGFQLRVWDIATGLLVTELPGRATDSAIAIDSTGRVIATSSESAKGIQLVDPWPDASSALWLQTYSRGEFAPLPQRGLVASSRVNGVVTTPDSSI